MIALFICYILAVPVYLAKRTGADYADLLLRHLPPGRAYSRHDEGLNDALAGYGIEWARVEERLLALINELDPTTATELLDAWERVFELPDPCDPNPPTTDAGRRELLKAKLVGRGGSQPAIIREVINAAGYAGLGIEIQIATLFRVDESAVDERLYDDTWTHAWWIWALVEPPQGFDQLECLFSTGDNPLKPSHSNVIFIDGLRANEVSLPA